MEELEIWKDIPDYKGYYKISNKGSVKSLSREVYCVLNGTRLIKGRVLKPLESKQEYYMVRLSREGFKKTFAIHKLMVLAFLGHGKLNKGFVVDHINNIRTDNNIKNLQIVSNRWNSSKDRQGYTSKYIGVHWYTKKKEWRASIQIKGVDIYLGRYDKEEDAAQAYQNRLKLIS